MDGLLSTGPTPSSFTPSPTVYTNVYINRRHAAGNINLSLLLLSIDAAQRCCCMHSCGGRSMLSKPQDVDDCQLQGCLVFLVQVSPVLVLLVLVFKGGDGCLTVEEGPSGQCHRM